MLYKILQNRSTYRSQTSGIHPHQNDLCGQSNEKLKKIKQF